MDIKGKVLNVPVYELLGGKVNDSIRCYASQLQFGWNEDVGPRGTAKNTQISVNMQWKTDMMR